MMTRTGGFGLAVLACIAAIGCVSYGYHETVSMGRVAPPVVPVAGSDQPFYDDLAPYGQWVHVSGPGWVWSPYDVQANWRPYELGHWVFTDYGWTWASDEEWGWAVYHYGRWHLDASYGWVWVPGTEWGPAWVAWHEGGGYVGWAPLPWSVSVAAGVSVNWASVSVSIAPSSWCFVGTRHLVNPALHTHIVPPSRNVSLIKVTQNVTNYTYIDNRVVNNGVRVDKVGRAVGHTIPRYRITETDTPGATRGGRVRGQEFEVFRHDPPRGRNSQRRPDPPGHDQRDRVRDLRREAEARDRYTPRAPERGSDPQGPPPSEPPAPPRGQEERNHGRETHPDSPHRYPGPPQRSAPNGPPTRNQPSEMTAPPSDAAAPPAERQSGSPASADRPNAATPPKRVEPPKGPSSKENAQEKGKAAPDAAQKNRKPKKAAPSSQAPDTDKSDKEKGNSEN